MGGMRRRRPEQERWLGVSTSRHHKRCALLTLALSSWLKFWRMVKHNACPEICQDCRRGVWIEATHAERPSADYIEQQVCDFFSRTFLDWRLMYPSLNLFSATSCEIAIGGDTCQSCSPTSTPSQATSPAPTILRGKYARQRVAARLLPGLCSGDIQSKGTAAPLTLPTSAWRRPLRVVTRPFDDDHRLT